MLNSTSCELFAELLVLPGVSKWVSKCRVSKRSVAKKKCCQRTWFECEFDPAVTTRANLLEHLLVSLRSLVNTVDASDDHTGGEPLGREGLHHIDLSGIEGVRTKFDLDPQRAVLVHVTLTRLWWVHNVNGEI
jgi:hypothetical protein